MFTHLRNGLRIIIGIEDRRAGHKHVSAGCRNVPDVVGFDAAIDFQANLPRSLTPLSFDSLPDCAQLGQSGIDKCLAAKPGVH